MTRARARRFPGLVLAGACALLLVGCSTVRGVQATARALDRAGYREVSVTVETGGGVDVVTIEAAGAPAGGGAGADDAAAIVWHTLPLRFDRMVVTLHGATTLYSSERLLLLFGARDPALDRDQAGDAVVHSGLVALLVVGGLLAGAGAVTGGLLLRRGVRRTRAARPGSDQDDGPSSGVGSGSPTAAGSAASDDADAIPS